MDLFPDYKPPENKNRCGDCKFRRRDEYRSGKAFQYCTQFRSGRTGNGLMKIKCKHKACHLFEEGEVTTIYCE